MDISRSDIDLRPVYEVQIYEDILDYEGAVQYEAVENGLKCESFSFFLTVHLSSQLFELSTLV